MKDRIVFTLLLLIVCISFVSPVQSNSFNLAVASASTEITLQPPTKDNFIHQYYPTLNWGIGAGLSVVSFASCNQRTLLEFGQSIPVGSTVVSATFSLSYFSFGYLSDDPVGRTYWAYRGTRADWTEGNQEGGVAVSNWNQYKTSTSWSTAGGDYSTTDGASVVMPDSSGWPKWVEWDITAQVQTAVTAGTSIEIVIKDASENAGDAIGAVFYSSEYTGDTSLRPKVFVVFNEPEPTPTPTPMPSPTPTPTPGPGMLIVAIGDSLTYGYPGFNEYESQLELLLGGGSWNVMNEGVNGDLTAQMLSRFNEDVIGHAPEYVLVWGGINDVQVGYDVSIPESNLQSMFTAAHNAEIVVVSLNIAPLDYLWTPTKRAAIDTINAWILGNATDIDFRIDIYDILEDPQNAGSILDLYDCGDGLHLSAEGYDAVACAVYDVIWGTCPTPGSTPTPSPSSTPESTANAVVKEAIEALNNTLIIWILAVIALVLTFLSLRLPILFFISAFVWVGLAISANATWIGIVAGLIALMCLLLFIMVTTSKRGRR
jgi:acyl-CoA thioesterase-1